MQLSLPADRHCSTVPGTDEPGVGELLLTRFPESAIVAADGASVPAISKRKSSPLQVPADESLLEGQRVTGRSEHGRRGGPVVERDLLAPLLCRIARTSVRSPTCHRVRGHQRDGGSGVGSGARLNGDVMPLGVDESGLMTELMQMGRVDAPVRMLQT